MTTDSRTATPGDRNEATLAPVPGGPAPQRASDAAAPETPAPVAPVPAAEFVADAPRARADRAGPASVVREIVDKLIWTELAPGVAPTGASVPLHESVLRRAETDGQLTRLRRTTRFATGLLVIVSVVFVSTRLLEAGHPWIAVVRATAEAAMVGALADWFAITALFRHPLGIPIPHTAIVPTRKDRIGKTLGTFVQNNFLSRELLAAKLGGIGATRRLAEWFARPANARAISTQVTRSLTNAAQVLSDDDVRDFLDRSVLAAVRRTPIAPLVGNVLAVVTAANHHQDLLDEALVVLDRMVFDNSEMIRDMIRAESPWWVPNAVDTKIHERVVTAIGTTLHAVSHDPAHPLRTRFDTAVHRFVERLRTSDDMLAKGEALKAELLAHPSVRQFTASVWADAKLALVRYGQRTEGDGLQPVERAIVAFGEALLEDSALPSKIDGWVLDAALGIIEVHSAEVGAFIAETVERWDPHEMSRKVELAMGPDLQFIRISGTIMGALVGLLLYLFGHLVG